MTPLVRTDVSILADLLREARRESPKECCGLLTGQRDRGAIRVNRCHASRNLASRPDVRFEIDPGLRLRLQRTLRGTGESVIGTYHSHPEGEAVPSPTDLASVFEPGLVWIIVAPTSVAGRRIRAWLAESRRFRELSLQADSQGSPSAGSIEGP